MIDALEHIKKQQPWS